MKAAEPVEALDEAQKSVAEAPAEARLVVTAGPGAGKTRTLIERTRHLLDYGGIDAGELLILSFSRAAVETVAARGRLIPELGRLPVFTFDGFASRLLIDSGADLDGLSFDRRIELATTLITSGRAIEENERFSELQHVMVDEAQDVVSLRATFLAAFLGALSQRADFGFTIFGDEAQAIYDFQFDERRRPGDRRRLLGWGVESLPTVPERHELTRNYRMETDRLAPLAESAGRLIRSQQGDGVDAWHYLKQEISDEVGAWEDLGEAADQVQAVCESPDRPTVAILCRTNAEVLHLGSVLQAAHLEVRVQHRAEDRGGAAWLAGAFSQAAFSTATMPPSAASGVDWMSAPQDALRRLRRAGVARGNQVDLRRLGALIRGGVCPEEVTAGWPAQVTVSTIHRAKGLEFDRVVVVDTGRGEPDPDHAWDEARILFVAATRPREGLEPAPRLDLRGPVRFLNESKRVAVCSWRRRRRPCRLEVRVSDSSMDWAPENREDGDELQKYLTRKLRVGDPITLERKSPDDADYPVFAAVHAAGRVIAQTTESFGRLVAREVLGRHPKRLTGLTAELPDTAAYSPAVSHRLGWGEHGLHLRARFFGLGLLRFTDD